MDRPETFLRNKVALLADFSEEQLRSLTNGSQIVAANPGDIIAHAEMNCIFSVSCSKERSLFRSHLLSEPRALQHISRTISRKANTPAGLLVRPRCHYLLSVDSAE